MNLKILAFPLLIFAVIVFSIWFVYPAYSELAVTRAKLDEIQKNLENLDQKIQTAERLNTEISSDEEYQKTLTSFLPSGKNEEEIVNELNDITFTQGMVVYNLSFEAAKIKPEDAPQPALDAAGNPLVDPNTGQPIYSETVPKIKTASASLGAIGDYDKVRGFLRKIIGLGRSNSIASIRIFKDEASNTNQESANTSNGILKMETTIDFKYLEKVKNTIDINDGIFTIGQLNLPALDEIQKIRNTAIPELRTDSQGKQNPFVL